MLPAIGSMTALPGQGRVGVLVSAQTIGEPENGRQLVALRVRDSGRSESARATPSDSISPASTAQQRVTGSPGSERPGTPAALAARLPAELSAGGKGGGHQAAAARSTGTPGGKGARRGGRRSRRADQLCLPARSGWQAICGRRLGGHSGVRLLSGDPAEAERIAGRLAAAANAATNPSAQDYAAARQAYAFGSNLGELPAPGERESGLDLTL